MKKLPLLTLIAALTLFGYVGCAHGPKAPAKPIATATPGAAPAAKEAALTLRRGGMAASLAGPLTGGSFGRYVDEQTKDYEQTNRDNGYAPADGPRISIDAVRANPAVVAPGEALRINLDYSVLLPKPDDSLVVIETRDLSTGGAPAGKTTIGVGRTGGTYRSSVPLTVPSGIEPGNYQVVVTIETEGGGSKDVRETFFKVDR